MRKGFTLIELLVVIAIIAILAAILFPVFARAREKARQTSCLSNVKQMALAVQMYSQDYDEKMPFAQMIYDVAVYQPWQDKTVSSGYYADLLYPYIKNKQVFVCPSRDGDWIGYGYNCYMGYIGNRQPTTTYTAPIYTGVALSTIQYPAQTVVIGDRHGGTYPSWAYYRLWTASYSGADYEPLPHNEGVNIAFCDGHAKWYRGTAANSVYNGGTLYYYADASH